MNPNICVRCQKESDSALCESCDWNNKENKKKMMNRRRNLDRKNKDMVMRSLGLVKVRGALGGTYWE